MDMGKQVGECVWATEKLGCKGPDWKLEVLGKKKLFWNLIRQAALVFTKSAGSEWTQQIWGAGGEEVTEDAKSQAGV